MSRPFLHLLLAGLALSLLSGCQQEPQHLQSLCSFQQQALAPGQASWLLSEQELTDQEVYRAAVKEQIGRFQSTHANSFPEDCISGEAQKPELFWSDQYQPYTRNSDNDRRNYANSRFVSAWPVRPSVRVDGYEVQLAFLRRTGGQTTKPEQRVLMGHRTLVESGSLSDSVMHFLLETWLHPQPALDFDEWAGRPRTLAMFPVIHLPFDGEHNLNSIRQVALGYLAALDSLSQLRHGGKLCEPGHESEKREMLCLFPLECRLTLSPQKETANE